MQHSCNCFNLALRLQSFSACSKAAIRKTPSFEKNPLLGIWRKGLLMDFSEAGTRARIACSLDTKSDLDLHEPETWTLDFA